MKNIACNLFPGGKNHALTMSYDDSCLPENEKLLSIFRTYGVRGTFHMNGNAFLNEYSVEDFRKTYEGFEISCHTLTHPHLMGMPRENLLRQILEDRAALEKAAGYPIRGMSYPFGDVDDNIINTFTACGMEYSRTVYATNNFYLPSNFMRWDPTTHHNGDLNGLYERFIPNGADYRVFYLWGHAHEFARANNWDVMERFCEKAAKDADKIWFATNIEIKDYVEASRALRFSYEMDTVYNPSCLDIWIKVGQDVVVIKPGLNTIA